MVTRTPPKSYLPAEEREALFREGGDYLVSLCESQNAAKAGDRASSWAWLALSDLPPHSLKFLKRVRGAQFIRDWGFNTKEADEVYGADWLDRDES